VPISPSFHACLTLELTPTQSTLGIYNFGNITTGDGNDTITGSGDMSRINDRGGSQFIYRAGIYNEGTINTGNGADSIVTDGGFEIPNGRGSVFLENGKDYVKGFGRGIFNGGNGQDTLELTSGSYIVGRSDTTVNFTQGSSIMITSELEKLIADTTIYDFSSLTSGQTIVVA
jgi:hypothetical protein